MKYLVIHNCTQCPKCAKPTQTFYKLACIITRDESGFWGKTLDNYPYIPDWCPLPDLEQHNAGELPVWIMLAGTTRMNHLIQEKEKCSNLTAQHLIQREIDGINWILQQQPRQEESK